MCIIFVVLRLLFSKSIAMKTINDLIKALQKLDPKQKSLPFVIYDTEHNQEYSLNNVDDSLEDRIDLNLRY